MLECGCLDFGPKTLVAGAAMRDGVAESVLNGEENMAAAGLLLGQPFLLMSGHGENITARDIMRPLAKKEGLHSGMIEASTVDNRHKLKYRKT
jgi:hypothetical protein